jgi:hypothetical protein
MDSFMSNSKNKMQMPVDTLVKSSANVSKNATIPDDSVKFKKNKTKAEPSTAGVDVDIKQQVASKPLKLLSETEILRIISSIKANKITDIQSIKDAVTFRDTDGFSVDGLTDHQLANIVLAVRSNIAEQIADVIFSVKSKDNPLDMSSKDKANIDSILIKLRDSRVTNMDQALEFVRNHSSDNPNLLSRISSQLASIVSANNQQNNRPHMDLKTDAYVSAASADPTKYQGVFKSNADSRSMQPKSVNDAKEFLGQIVGNKHHERELDANPVVVDQVSNMLLSSYLKTIKRDEHGNIVLPEEMLKKHVRQLVVEDVVMHKENVLQHNISYINDIAAKVATQKAKTIITCRLVGEVTGAVSSAIGMASFTGASPLIGLAGAFVLTMMATVLGYAIGKVGGETIGKLMTGTKLSIDDLDEYEELEEKLKEYELDMMTRYATQPAGEQENNSSDDSEDEESEEEDDGDEELNDAGIKPLYKYVGFKDMDVRYSDAIKGQIKFTNK